MGMKVLSEYDNLVNAYLDHVEDCPMCDLTTVKHAPEGCPYPPPHEYQVIHLCPFARRLLQGIEELL